MGRAAVRPGGKEPPAQLPDGVDVRLHAVPFPGAGSRIGWQPVARWTTSWTASPRRPPRQLGAVAPTNRGRAARQPARWTSTAVTTAHASSRCTSASVRAWDRRVGATAPMRWYAACQRTEKESLGVCRPARPWRRTARAPACTSETRLAPATLSTPAGVEPDPSPLAAVFTSEMAQCMKARYASASAVVPASAIESQVNSGLRWKRTIRPSRNTPVAKGVHLEILQSHAGQVELGRDVGRAKPYYGGS